MDKEGVSIPWFGVTDVIVDKEWLEEQCREYVNTFLADTVDPTSMENVVFMAANGQIICWLLERALMDVDASNADSRQEDLSDCIGKLREFQEEIKCANKANGKELGLSATLTILGPDKDLSKPFQINVGKWNRYYGLSYENARMVMTALLEGVYLQMGKAEDAISRQAALACFSTWTDRNGDVHAASEMPEYKLIEELPPV